MKRAENLILVIFGASGDLAYRKLIPSLYALFQQNLLPEGFAVLGVGRSPLSDASFQEKMAEGLDRFVSKENLELEKRDSFLKKLHYVSIETQDAASYIALKHRLRELDHIYGIGGNYIFYLAIPPLLYKPVAFSLEQQGLHWDANVFRRIIIEKPFGVDLASAQELNADLLKVFREDQIYRIDHYLGKETVQNLLVTRFSNGIFEPLWNRNYIHHVEITSSESLGVENRGGYYNQSGALRDMVQNHLLQLVGLVAMEPPTIIGASAIRNEVLKVFQALKPIKEEEVADFVIRGQYTESHIRGEKSNGYRQEKGVPEDSRTETFMAMKFFIDNWRWAGVPFYIRTGKRLPTRVTEVVIYFKQPPHHLFASNPSIRSATNQLVIRIQPDEGLLLKFGMKLPGAGYNVQDVGMDFHYTDLANTYLPTAYERLLLDCMLGDATLYARGDSVLEAWKFVQPIINAWNNDSKIPVHGYPGGTWGPRIADDLVEGEGMTWRYPCKNLTSDDLYCEL